MGTAAPPLPRLVRIQRAVQKKVDHHTESAQTLLDVRQYPLGCMEHADYGVALRCIEALAVRRPHRPPPSSPSPPRSRSGRTRPPRRNPPPVPPPPSAASVNASFDLLERMIVEYTSTWYKHPTPYNWLSSATLVQGLVLNWRDAWIVAPPSVVVKRRKKKKIGERKAGFGTTTPDDHDEDERKDPLAALYTPSEVLKKMIHMKKLLLQFPLDEEAVRHIVEAQARRRQHHSSNTKYHHVLMEAERMMDEVREEIGDEHGKAPPPFFSAAVHNAVMRGWADSYGKKIPPPDSASAAAVTDKLIGLCRAMHHDRVVPDEATIQILQLYHAKLNVTDRCSSYVNEIDRMEALQRGDTGSSRR
jgi:hypothetical protein